MRRDCAINPELSQRCIRSNHRNASEWDGCGLPKRGMAAGSGLECGRARSWCREVPASAQAFRRRASGQQTSADSDLLSRCCASRRATPSPWTERRSQPPKKSPAAASPALRRRCAPVSTTSGPATSCLRSLRSPTPRTAANFSRAGNWAACMRAATGCLTTTSRPITISTNWSKTTTRIRRTRKRTASFRTHSSPSASTV